MRLQEDFMATVSAIPQDISRSSISQAISQEAEMPVVTDLHVVPVYDAIEASNAIELSDVSETPNRLGYLFAKHLMDITLSLIALVVLSPLFLLIAIAVKIDSRGPVIFKQTRVGKGGKYFTMYKFRSMHRDAEERLKELQSKNERTGPVFKMAKDPRVTRVGKFIRKTCIDELPQLVNILKRDMSIVGPRPPLPAEVEQYTAHQKQRLNVRGGLTCYWQASDRNVTFHQWVESDIKYINERCLKLDFFLIFKTVQVILRQASAK